MSTKISKVIVDVVLVDGDSDPFMSVPESVILNTMVVGRELEFNIVPRLSYAYNWHDLAHACQDHGFTHEDGLIMKELIELNSGYISPMLLRRHFGVSFATCSRLAEALIAKNQACLAPETRTLYLLPAEKRKEDWS